MRQYLPRASDALHPYATPGAAVRLAGLPPTLLVTAQDDPMRDEAEAYARRLRGEAVPVDELRLPLTTVRRHTGELAVTNNPLLTNPSPRLPGR